MNKYVLLLLTSCLIGATFAQEPDLDDYNISWTSPGINSLGSMPLGNGDIGINAWVEENGDLVFYLSKTDAWSENGQLLKLGRIRITLSPNPYRKESFRQELNLKDGEINVNYGESGVKLWVDANHPVVQVDISSKKPVNASVCFESWRKFRRPVKGDELHAVYGVVGVTGKGSKCTTAVFQEPDTIISGVKNQIIWYHHNSYSYWKDNLDLQSLDEYVKSNTDPLLNRTFGALIEAEGMSGKADTLLTSRKPSVRFQVNIYPLTGISSSVKWKKSLTNSVKELKKLSSKERKDAHDIWWNRFWDRSYIYLSSKDQAINREARTVTQGYILQRFINACSGRGNAPIKFNGSIFTVDCYNRNDKFRGFDADFRQWGGPYWWQNTRLPYWSMLISGDFDLMKPMFGMYLGNIPIRKLATRNYYSHEGAYFPETMNFWGTFASENYGCDRTGLPDGFTTNPYIRYYWQGGLELSLIMLDYYSFTRRESFAADTLVPLVSEVLTFFDKHWNRGPDGKILFSPAMSLETFHKAVNPLPEIVGIRTVAEKMLALPGKLINETQRTQYRDLMNDLPAIPLREVNNETVIAPAAEFSDKQNVENPELYGIFPYRTFGVGKPDLELARRTFSVRTHKDNFGWQQNSIQAAYLGLSEDARRMVTESFSIWDKNFRFPAFWGPNYDWTPDQDHGSVAVNALQRMIVQYENDKVILLPAWPKEWDVKFKVNAPGNTTIEGLYENGKMVMMKKMPEDKIIVVLEN